MGLHHRKLFSVQDCNEYCHETCRSLDCDKCINSCLSPPKDNPLSPPPPSPFIYSDSKHTKISSNLIITFAVVATAFFVLCCYAIYVKFFSSRNRSRRRVPSSRQQAQQETHDEFLDEEHGPMVDHPIWYIRTPGLHQSIINAITVCKYNKGEGLIEGTECSVCLSEFQEDESLRLLPKCNHAFHLPCIDTWLRSHTNCPMCRAPIVNNPARVPSMEPNVVDPSFLGGAQMENLENRGGDIGGGMEENDAAELRNGSEEEEEVEVEGAGRRACENEGSAAEVASMPPRRSVSLDSSSAAKISADLATVVSVEESHGNSKRKLGEAKELVVSKRVAAKGGSSSSSSSSSRTGYLQSAPASMKRSRSFNGKHRLSWSSRSQKKTNALVRSF